MKGTVLYGPRDVRFEDREEPRLRGSLLGVMKSQLSR
jgi:hypothetical protein